MFIARIRFYMALLGTLALLAACAPAAQQADPVDAVEQYLTAKVNGDEAGVRALLCSGMEADLQREATSFSAVTGVRIEGMDCQRSGESDVVVCTGEIVASYGAEDTNFPLRAYRVVEEDGEWRWCGETAAP